MGWSVAWHLRQALPAAARITVVAPEEWNQYKSTVLSAGGLRQQFSIPANVEFSLFGLDFFRNFANLDRQQRARTTLQPDHALQDLLHIKMRENGYTFLASTPESAQTLAELVEMQCRLGAATQLATPTQLRARYPWLCVDDIEAGTMSYSGEGFIDPWEYLANLRALCLQTGGIDQRQGRVDRLELDARRTSVAGAWISSPTVDADPAYEPVDLFINCAGCFSNDVFKGTHLSVPVRARKRYVFAIRSSAQNAPGINSPLLVDPSGVYFRPELAPNTYITGVSPKADADPDYSDFSTLAELEDSLFHDQIWPALYNRVPDAFDALRVISSWAGFYDYNTFDQNALIGLMPGMDNLYVCTGFSGHGLQHSPAAGYVISQLVTGQGHKLGSEAFAVERVAANAPILEAGIV
ncbi:uncharacterized protein MONBRDRAFT_35404 [Monosiga brevicollis MX1]|uniref:FAD-dependent oxidoreductase domain-containing protein 1 n=1 Tax=Monosiga brevicollis TaxID=81824 RepID=A9UNT5_MONBE|nr:uncharacterized protein MONBRDRAFT_35404 [Monosiga brevicollis MX1]EDQ92301.1 predicted protein [Monosiga brevicollis MX1]|eukprot:XP_001742063.1 hypothetical protein [Monosiga brevicollis MX1]